MLYVLWSGTREAANEPILLQMRAIDVQFISLCGLCSYGKTNSKKEGPLRAY